MATEFGSGEEELKMKDNIDDISKFALKISSDESKMAEVKKFIYLLSFISLHIKDKNIFEIIKN